MSSWGKTDMEREDVSLVERVEFSESDDEGFEYTAVDVGDAGSDDDEDDLDKALASIQNERANASELASTRATTQVRPAVVDDFMRNVMIKLNMARTLDAFNTEWYEMQSKGKLTPEDIAVVPDIYLRNQALDEQVRELRSQVSRMEEIAAKAKGTWDTFRKERDFHRMHHRRVVQEKKKLTLDIKRLREHFVGFEPTLAELRGKYEVAMKEKMLMRLERDRMASRVAGLEAQLAAMAEPAVDAPAPKPRRKKRGEDSPIPEGPGVNPMAELEFEPAPADRFQLSKTFRGHQNSVSSLAFHPKKPLLATVSDDETWKLWSVPDCELIMSGEGHRGWVGGLAFHPRGHNLATCGGDNTVKLWDFVSASCSATFVDHTQAVWDVAFHHTGDFLVSCSMDHTARMWDLNSSKCRQTFRGHVDSVNSVCFQPYTNNICTGAGDKTVSLWDIRSGLCVQTFFGHSNAVNNVTFNSRGDTIASCDADGVVKLWDVRKEMDEKGSLSAGQHPLNKVSFDRSGVMLAAASDDGTVKVFNCNDMSSVAELRGHEDAVQAVAWQVGRHGCGFCPVKQCPLQ